MSSSKARSYSVSSTEGPGQAIFKAGSLYVISKVFADLAMSVVLALILAAVVSHIERRLPPWRHGLQ